MIAIPLQADATIITACRRRRRQRRIEAKRGVRVHPLTIAA